MTRVLMVVTSHSELGKTGRKTGLWLEEFTSPYYVFIDEGCEVTVASPKGGDAPVDPESLKPDALTESTRRFSKDQERKDVLKSTKPLDQMDPSQFDVLFYPGGHGPMWDLAASETNAKLLLDFWGAKKVVGAMCHGPAALTLARVEGNRPFVAGRKVTGFTNTEEQAVGLVNAVPFLLENKLKELDAYYSKGPDWAPFVVADGRLVTGQNPASAVEAARAVLRALKGDVSESPIG